MWLQDNVKDKIMFAAIRNLIAHFIAQRYSSHHACAITDQSALYAILMAK